MERHIINVLLIGDKQSEIQALTGEFSPALSPQFKVNQASSLRSGLERLAAGPIDIILVDLALPDSQGIQAYQQVFACATDTPIVVLAGEDDEGQAILAVKAGAQDYLVKEETSSRELRRALLHAIERHRLRKQAEEKLHLQSAALDAAANAIVITDRQGNIEWANLAFSALTGYSADEIQGKSLSILKSGRHAASFYRRLWETILSGQVWRGVMINRKKDGSLYTEEQTITPVFDERPESGGREGRGHVSGSREGGSREGGGTLAHFIAIKMDITQRKSAEEEIERQAERAKALVSTAAQLNSRLDLPAVLEKVCAEAARALKAPAASILLYDAQLEGLFPSASYGIPKIAEEKKQVLPRAYYERIIEMMGPVGVFPDVLAIPGFPNYDYFQSIQARTLAFASMMREGRMVGSLNIHSLGELREFSENDLALLQGLANQASMAISNAVLYEEVRQHASQLALLYDAGLALNSVLEPLAQIMCLLNIAMDALHAGRATYYRYYESKQDLCLELSVGYDRELSQELINVNFSTRDENTILGWIAAHRKPVNLPEVNVDPRYQEIDPQIRSGVWVPIEHEGSLLGVMGILSERPKAFSPQDERLLVLFANQAAVALENARLFNENSELFNSLQQSNLELALAYDITLEGWSHALELRDMETEGHCQRVTQMTIRLARKMGITEAELAHVRRGALLHDIGKMGIPDRILSKPGPLSEEEWEIMRKHPVYAHQLLSPIAYLRPALDVPYCHHEKWDGSGYPRGLEEEQIPLAARIFAVVDVWDALSSNRPYRDAWPQEKILAYIQEQSGKHFDPQVVEVFENLLRADSEQFLAEEDSPVFIPAILVVDDEENVTSSLLRFLQDRFRVFTANSGEAALEILTREKIAVILADQRMPDITGLQLLQRAWEISPHTLGLLISAYSDMASINQSLRLRNVRGHILKPWDPEELMAKLSETVQEYILSI